MKKLFFLLFMGVCLWLPVTSHAMDFKISGIWTMGFGVGEVFLTKDHRSAAGRSTNDDFVARQRVFLQLDARANESLSGTVRLLLGATSWGQANQGGALGADGTFIKVRNAYLDWTPPGINLKTRMGIQTILLPNAASGKSTILFSFMTGINSYYEINNNFGINVGWFRPFNDNYVATGVWRDGSDPSNYLDNMDLFLLTVPMKFDGFSITPWAMYGFQGRNTGRFAEYTNNTLKDGAFATTTTPFLNRLSSNGTGQGLNASNFSNTSKTFGSLFWAGLPIKISAFSPFNFEFELDYGYVEEMGRFDVMARNNPQDIRRGSTRREGWQIKGLAEYKLDWGIPGIFGWYSSGDDGNVKNGSERMPSISGYQEFTSFMGHGALGWGVARQFLNKNLTLAGTWGVGAQLRDMSFVENLYHTLRVAYWGGTNSPSMVKYMTSAWAWESTSNYWDGPYMTTNDSLVEFNFINKYKMYENFDVWAEAGYIINNMDAGTWKKDYANWGSYSKRDAWKATLIFQYSF